MRKSIFIIEDDPDISELMQIVIENEGFLVKNFLNAEKAVDKIVEEKPSLVIMDLHVGKIDGAILVKKLKYKKETAKIPVIIVSAKNSLEEISRECEADGYLKKPFNISDLTQLIDRLI